MKADGSVSLSHSRIGLIVNADALFQVDWRNDPGPTGEGADASNRATTIAEVYQWLAEPGWGVPNKK